jgi:hypothetical protein
MMHLEPIPMDSPHVLQRGLAADEVLAVPTHIVGHVDDGSLPWDVAFVVGVDDDQVPVLDEVTLRRRPGGVPVSAAAIRGVPLTRLRDEAIERGATRFIRGEEDGKLVLSVKSDRAQRLTQAERTKVAKRPAGPAKTHRRNAPPDEILLEALRLYENAKTRGEKDPIEKAAKQMGYARSTIGNYIQRARGLER